MRKIRSVSLEELKEVFSDKRFKTGINKATKKGMNMGVESQFLIWRGVFNAKKRYMYDCSHDLSKSTELNLQYEDFEEIDKNEELPLLVYHCHVNNELHPSKSDLRRLFQFRQFYNLLDGLNSEEHMEVYRFQNYHIEAIGGIQEGGKFHNILLIQNRSNKILEDEGEFIYYQLRDVLEGKRDNESVAEEINNIPFWQAHLLKYTKEKQDYKISEDQLGGLEKFAYTPEISETIIL